MEAFPAMMFEYFPDNYPWSMALQMALNAGAIMSEADEVLAPIKPLAGNNDDEANQAWHDAWVSLGERSKRLADQDAEAGRTLSAGQKYHRAAIYFMTGERMGKSDSEERLLTYRSMLDCFQAGLDCLGSPVERVEVPYKDASLPALFYPADGGEGATVPCLIHFDGLDVMKEYLYLAGLPQTYAARGVATLLVDHPGIGEALRLRGMKLTPKLEEPAAAALDYVETRGGLDADRIGIAGISLGGYYAPRAAGFEPRLKCAVAWGAINDYGEITRKRLDGTGTSLSVSHWEEHMNWVLGTSSRVGILEVTSRMSLDEALPNIRCPFLILHGESDRQIPLEMAEKTINAAVNSPRTELKVFTAETGGVEHCQVDNSKIAVEYMADWVADVLNAEKDRRF
ncbi:MAG: hypothetical protein CMM26_01270 [Rhodospirillaceae bacterium]|nr:hypothetical protein [Rhodospirillaceae bacterium]